MILEKLNNEMEVYVIYVKFSPLKTCSLHFIKSLTSVCYSNKHCFSHCLSIILHYKPIFLLHETLIPISLTSSVPNHKLTVLIISIKQYPLS